jgi:autotransporter-associated beta strand protein
LTTTTVTVANVNDVILKFKHRYSFPDTDPSGGWDGGAVFVSVDGGAPTYLPAEAFTAGGYTANTNASAVFGGNKEVFAGGNGVTEIESIANLGSFAVGKTIAVTFTGGWDWSYTGGPPDWEIRTVEVTNSATTLLNVDLLSGPSGFTVTNEPTVIQGPWKYGNQITCQFELNATNPGPHTADRFVPNTSGAVINLDYAKLKVVVLSGTLEAGDSFSLFDLSGGSTLAGNYSSLELPVGTWDYSGLQPGGDGTITLLDSSAWTQTAEGTYSWTDVANWTNGVPNTAGKLADLRLDLAGAQTIELNQVTTVGTIFLGDTASANFPVTLAAGTGGSLIMDVASGSATIARTNSAGIKDTISADIALNHNLIVSDANGSSSNYLNLSGAISGTGKSVTLSGVGSVYLSGTNTFDGGLILNGAGATGASGNYCITPAALGANSLTVNGGNIGVGNWYFEAPDWKWQSQPPASANDIFLNEDFYSHYNFQTGTGTVTIAKAGIKARGSITIQGVVTGSGSLNGLDVNLSGVEGMGACPTITSDISMRDHQIMTHDSDWNLQAWPAIISGVISDGGHGYNLTKAGTSATVFSGANTYSGDTSVTGGALVIGNDRALQNSALVTSAGHFDLASVTTPILGGLKGTTDMVAAFTLDVVNIYTQEHSVRYNFGAVTELTLNPLSGTCDYTGVIANGASNMKLTKTGAGTQILGGVNTYTGDTTVSAGALTLADNGGLTFVLTDTGSNQVKGTGTGTVTFNGDFYLDSSAVTVTTGSWTLVDVTTLTEDFTTSFSMAGVGWSQTSDVWTKVDGTQLWTFTEATGVLTLAVAGPEIAVEESATDIPNNGTKGFGEVLVGAPKLLTFTVKNTGVTNLTDLAITKFGTHKDDFTVTQVDPVAPVLPAGSATFTVTFTPSSIGVRTAYIEIANNDANESPFTINLSGTGIDAFASWAVTNITAHDSGADAGTTGDPDGDGSNNLNEFAFGGDPLSGSDNGKVFSQFKVRELDANGTELILTVAVLADTSATFVADGNSLIGLSPAGGITYRIEGSNDLNFSNVQVGQVATEATTAMNNVLPTGYVYRSFVLVPGGTPAKGFLRAVVVK